MIAEVASSIPRLLANGCPAKIATLGAILSLTLAGGLTAAESGVLRYQRAYLFAADGTRSPIERLPSEELQPTPQPQTAFALEFNADGLRYPVSSVMFNPSFGRKAPPAETPAAAVDEGKTD